jgi:hypothetical protein
MARRLQGIADAKKRREAMTRLDMTGFLCAAAHAQQQDGVVRIESHVAVVNQ